MLLKSPCWKSHRPAHQGSKLLVHQNQEPLVEGLATVAPQECKVGGSWWHVAGCNNGNNNSRIRGHCFTAFFKKEKFKV